MVTGNVSFKGYKNVFCAFDVPLSNSKYVTFISMQLNDDKTGNDLSQYHEIRELQGDVFQSESDDILTLTYINDKNLKREHLYFNSRNMYWGDELRQLEEKFVPKLMSHEKYKQEENLHMKAYTLLASLTKRMSYVPFCSEDHGKIDVFKSVYNNMYALFKNQNEAFKLLEESAYKRVKFQHLAFAFNKCISITMQHFFL